MPSSRSTPYRNFYLTLIAGFLGITIPTVTINIIVDPYGIFKSPTQEGFNNIKTRQPKNTRLFKPIHASQIEYDTLLLGTSRVELGLKAESPGLGKTRKAYNLGTGAQTIHESIAYANHAITTNPNLKTIIMGMDFWAFYLSQKSYEGFESYRLNRSGLHPWDALRYGFSVPSLWASLEVFQASGKHPKKHMFTDRGTMHFPWPIPNRSDSKWSQEWFKFFFRLVPNPNGVKSQHFDELQQLVEVCKLKKIDLQLVITPPHTLNHRLIEKFLDVEDYENWKRQLVALGPVWDFSDVNSVTTEPVSVDMVNYDDISHYSQTVGDWILARVLAVSLPELPEDFGKRITLQNIEQHLVAVRSRYATWKQNNPNDLKQLDDYWTKSPFKNSAPKQHN